ncbi:helix-hairpin-helix domain-containing protein [Halanaerobaculum tunisiense]
MVISSRQEDGYVLLVTLVVLLAIGILVPSLTRLVENEFIITTNYRQQIENYYLTEGLLEIASQKVKTKLTEVDYITQAKLEELSAQITGDQALTNPREAGEIELEYRVQEIVAESSKLALASSSQEELEALPEIGAELGERIVANKPYQSLVELKQIKGIGPETYATIKQYLTVIGDSKINLNTAPAEVLVTLPEIGEGLAAEIVDHREDDCFTAVSKIEDVSGIGDSTYQDLKEGSKVTSQIFKVTVRVILPDQQVTKQMIINLEEGG